MIYHRTGMFESVHKQVLETLLQQKYYQVQVDEQLKLVLDTSTTTAGAATSSTSKNDD